MENKKFEPSKKITTADKTVMCIWEGKLHSWEGPALIPQGNKRKSEYYIHGVKYSKDKFEEALKSQVGLPFYKQASAKGTTNRF